MGSICHADGAQTPSGHCAVSMLIHESVGFPFSALGLLFNYLHIRSGAIHREDDELMALSISFMGKKLKFNESVFVMQGSL